MTFKSTRLWFNRRYQAHRVASHELRKARSCDFMVVSRAKSGRTWLRAMLSRLYQQHFDLAENQLLEYDNFHKQNPGAATVYFSHGHSLRDRVAKPAWQKTFGSKRIVFMVRNPLDVVVSEYFQSTKRATDQKRELLQIDRDVAMFDFVMHNGKVGLPATIAYMNAWAPVIERLGNATMVRYEDMRAHPVESLGRLVEFLGAPFSADEIREAVEFTSFENLQRLEKENFFNNKRLQARNLDDPNSFKVRRGKVGGFADYFNEGQIAEMERLITDKLSPFYGYGRASRTEPVGPA